MDNNIQIYHGINSDVGVLGNRIYVFPNGVHSQSKRGSKTNKWSAVYRDANDTERLRKISEDREKLRELVDRLTKKHEAKNEQN